mmetsp:Transcript_22600/g.35814  ORF Transcript_22600/g.35814 Transcript_22600/m.35814 type:complete len:92 (+) Transcript_22600:978-1253(+)
MWPSLSSDMRRRVVRAQHAMSSLHGIDPAGLRPKFDFQTTRQREAGHEPPANGSIIRPRRNEERRPVVSARSGRYTSEDVIQTARQSRSAD